MSVLQESQTAMDDFPVDVVQCIAEMMHAPSHYRSFQLVCKKWAKAGKRIKNNKIQQFTRTDTTESAIPCRAFVDKEHITYTFLPNLTLHGSHVVTKQRVMDDFVLEKKRTTKRYEFGVLKSTTEEDLTFGEPIAQSEKFIEILSADLEEMPLDKLIETQ